MITSFEVGAVFKIINQASPVLKTLSGEVKGFNDLITATRDNLKALGRGAGLGALQKRLADLGVEMRAVQASGASMATGTIRNFSTLNSRMAMATANANSLAAALGRVQAAGAAVAIPALPRGRYLPGPGAPGAPRPPGHGGAGRGNGLHVSGVSARIPGGHAHFRGGGNMAMAGLGALAYGVYLESEIEDIAARAIMTGQVKIAGSGMTSMDAFKRIREVIQTNAAKGGFSPKEVGEAILGSERQFAGLTFQKRMDVLDILLPAAMQEARFKETPLKESAEALVGLAHMTGTYDPVKLPELYRKFNFASMITPASLPEFTRALSYSMPSLVAGMGMDPDVVMFITAMNQAAGIKSTKAGTWVQAFFGKLMPDVGANLNHSQVKHNEALEGLGLLRNGVPTWMVKGDNGKTDWMASLLKLAPVLGQHLQALPETQRLQILDQIFGKQGGREAGLMNLKEFVDQFPRLAQLMKTAPTGESFLGEFSNASPVQQARQAWADLQNVLMDISTIVLPPLTQALQGFDTVLKVIKNNFPQQGSFGGIPLPDTMGDALKKGMGPGAVIGGIIGLPFGVPWLGAAGGAVVGGTITGARHLFGFDKTSGTAPWPDAANENASIKALPNDTPGGAAFDQPMGSYRRSSQVLPPPANITIEPSKVSIVLDNRAIGEAQIAYMARQGAAASGGSRYFDPMHSAPAFDTGTP